MKSSKNKKKNFFCTIFSFITGYFHFIAKDLCEVANGEFSESSVSSWRTRNAPGSSETFSHLKTAVLELMKERNLAAYYEKKDYIVEVQNIINTYYKIPQFLMDPTYSLAELVELTMNFAYSKENNCQYSATNLLEQNETNHTYSNAKTEAVVFDFDGTLSIGLDTNTLWDKIWEILGYDIKEWDDIKQQFCREEISYSQLCSIAEKKFKERSLNRKQLDKLVKDVKLIEGTEFVLKELERRDIKTYIVSGSVKYIIRKSLGALIQYVTGGIDANIFDFDENGYLCKIIGTEYDYAGKADKISKICDELHILPEQVLFVGNSYNDEWVHRAGVRTLAINPRDTNIYNYLLWHNCIKKCDSLIEILNYI